MNQPLNSQADPEIARLILAGQKIEAIKRYREITGQGLKEAKDAVEAMAAGIQMTVVRQSLNSQAESEIANLVFAGQKIEAIKRYREVTGQGLKEAKDAVESMTVDLRMREPGKFSSPAVATKGCFGMMAVLLGIASLAVTLAWRAIA